MDVRWRLASLLLLVPVLSMVPGGAAGPYGPGDGPLTLSVRLTEGGVPFQGTLWASQQVEDAWRYAEAATGPDGTVVLHLWPGQAHLNLHRGDLGDAVVGGASLDLKEDLAVAQDLEPAPASVPVDLRIVDAATGEPLADAQAGPQMLFGPHLCIGQRAATMTMTGSPGQAPPSPPPSEPCDLQWTAPGRLQGLVPPGTLILSLSTRDQAVCVLRYEEPEREPCRMHAPASRWLAAPAGGSLAATLPLLAVPEPDAGVEGYLVSNLTGEALPRKHLSFRGTGDYASVYFSAYLDGHGSYRLRVPAGDYTVRAWVCGHDELVQRFTAPQGETLRLDLLLRALGTTPRPTTTSSPDNATSGSGGGGGGGSGGGGGGGGATVGASGSTYTGTQGNQYPACDHTPTPTTVGAPVTEEPTASRSSTTAAAQPEDTEVRIVGTLAVADFGGGLGPYGDEPADADDPPAAPDGADGDGTDGGDGDRDLAEPERFSSAAPAATLVLALAALAVRRRLP